jgi:hypothetical protein
MKRSFIWVAILVLVSSGLALAQETTTGTIFGRVTDEQGGVIPGATVTVTGATGEKVAITDANGRYNVPYLTPGTYSIRVELAGFAPSVQEGAVVRLGQRTELMFTLRVGTVAETITVTETSPVVDTTTTTIGGTLDSDVLERIPIGRTFSDTLYIVPGVSGSGRVGRANPAISGATGLENAYIVDGVNITNSGYGGLGSYSIIFGSLGTGVTYDFIDEIQVKTAGFEAEFGQTTGGVVNIVTKTGTNSFNGSLFGYTRLAEADWETLDLVEWNDGEQVTNTENSDVGVAIGGPIVPDKAFFFGAVNPQWQTRTRVAPPGFPLETLGELDRDRQVTSYSAKATFQAGSGHRLDASFFGDPATGDMGPQRRAALLRTDTAGFSEITYGGHNQTFRYSGVMSDNWFIEGSFARATNKIEETPSVNEWNVTDQTVSPSVRSGGIGFYEVGNDGKNYQYQIKSTNLFGSHQLRYGFMYEDIKYDNVIQRTGPPITLSDGVVTATGAEVRILPDDNFGQIYRVVRANTSNVRETEQQYTSFFVQDKFDIGDRVTISAGVRYEQQKLTGNLADFKWDGNWAPRLGVIIDPTGEGRGKIYGNWGRFFAKIPNDLAARALSADAGVTVADYFDAGLTQPVPEGVEALDTTVHLLYAGLHPADFDPDSKSTYLDEVVAGFEYEAIPELNLGIRYVYRDMPRVLEDIGTPKMIDYFTGEYGSVEYFITNPDENTPASEGSAFEKPLHKYHSVEFTMDKRFSDNWALLGSYRWSDLNGYFEGFFRNDNGQSDPGITSLFDFPTNDPTYTEIGVPQFGFSGDIRFLGALGEGPLPNDRTHQFKLYGTYAMDNGLSLGAGFNIGSGQPLTPFAANPAYDSDGEIPEAPRGSGIETTDNGFQERTDAEFNLNLNASYSLYFGEQRLVLIADLFNLFNNQYVTQYTQNTEISFQSPEVDYGRVWEYADPFQLRVGARFEF